MFKQPENKEEAELEREDNIEETGNLRTTPQLSPREKTKSPRSRVSEIDDTNNNANNALSPRETKSPRKKKEEMNHNSKSSSQPSSPRSGITPNNERSNILPQQPQQAKMDKLALNNTLEHSSVNRIARSERVGVTKKVNHLLCFCLFNLFFFFFLILKVE